MNTSRIVAIKNRLLGVAEPRFESVGRRRTCDVAYGLRMPAGVAGDISRHVPPGTIEQCLLAAAVPPAGFGLAVVTTGDTENAVRLVQAGDDALTAIYGITVRPFPFQPATATNYGAVGFGGGAPAAGQPVDVLRSGYILGLINGSPVKGGRVYVWIGASAGAHVQGAFEIAASGANTILLDQHTLFQGGVDANSVGEIGFNI